MMSFSSFATRDSTPLPSSKNDKPVQKDDPLLSLGNHFLDLTENYKNTDLAKAILYCDSAEQTINKNTSAKFLARLYTTRGNLYTKSGNLLLALLDYQRGIESQNLYSSDSLKNGYLQLSIGNLFYKLHQFADAKAYFEEAIQLFSGSKNNEKGEGLSIALNNKGLAEMKLGDSKAALQSFEESLKGRIDRGYTDRVNHSLTHLMEVYIANSNIRAGDSLYHYAFANSMIDSSSMWYPHFELQYGQILIMDGNTSKAYQQLQKINEATEHANQFDLQTLVSQVQIEYYDLIGDYQAAEIICKDACKAAMENRRFSRAAFFCSWGIEISQKQNNLAAALDFSKSLLVANDSIDNIVNSVISHLFEYNQIVSKTHLQNKELKTDSENYQATVKGQRWMLFISIGIIVLLSLLIWYVYYLSKKYRQNQHNQRELNQRILAVVNNTESHIVSLDSEGMIRLINQSAIDFFKSWLKCDIKAGDFLIENIQNDEAKNIWLNWFEKSKESQGWREVSKINVENNTYFFLENFSAITRENGKFAGLVMVGNDVTKEHEFAIRQAEQKATLEKSIKTKEKMLSILAHDLKDAIYSAHTLSGMVVETPEQFPQSELVHLFGLLHTNFERTKNLLHGLLDWMKTQTGALKAKPRDFNLGALFSDLITECEARASGKGIALISELDNEIEVHADREMIKTVLRNLVNNAIKFTEMDKGRIVMQAFVINEKVEIHVKDNGNGINPKDQHRLFQFGGGYSTLGTNKEEGTGFGLTLCKELLGLNDSCLQLDSDIGKGADFYFSLTLVDKKKSVLKHSN